MTPLNHEPQRTRFGAAFIDLGYEEAIIPSLWGSSTFEQKVATPELMEQMWLFKDRGDRDCCLNPSRAFLTDRLFKAVIKRSSDGGGVAFVIAAFIQKVVFYSSFQFNESAHSLRVRL